MSDSFKTFWVKVQPFWTQPLLVNYGRPLRRPCAQVPATSSWSWSFTSFTTWRWLEPTFWDPWSWLCHYPWDPPSWGSMQTCWSTQSTTTNFCWPATALWLWASSEGQQTWTRHRIWSFSLCAVSLACGRFSWTRFSAPAQDVDVGWGAYTVQRGPYGPHPQAPTADRTATFPWHLALTNVGQRFSCIDEERSY